VISGDMKPVISNVEVFTQVEFIEPLEAKQLNVQLPTLPETAEILPMLFIFHNIDSS
jgi:hypothetical protein